MKSAVARTEAAVSLVDFLLAYGNDQEAAFLEIIGHICDRGDLNTFCSERGIRIGMLIAWIRRDADRSRRYELALMDRRQLDAEAVRGKWTEVMNEKPEAPPKWSDVLKASELMGKYSGVLHDGPVVVEREQASESELREQLAELLSRNPDVQALVMRGGDVVDAELVTEVVNGIEQSRTGQVVGNEQRQSEIPDAGNGSVLIREEIQGDVRPENKIPRREESAQAKAARAIRRPKPVKQEPPDMRVSVNI